MMTTKTQRAMWFGPAGGRLAWIGESRQPRAREEAEGTGLGRGGGSA